MGMPRRWWIDRDEPEDDRDIRIQREFDAAKDKRCARCGGKRSDIPVSIHTESLSVTLQRCVDCGDVVVPVFTTTITVANPRTCFRLYGTFDVTPVPPAWAAPQSVIEEVRRRYEEAKWGLLAGFRGFRGFKP